MKQVSDGVLHPDGHWIRYGKSQAATGKCTVVKVDGTKMVIECNEPTKGFAKGNQIKIKTDKKKNNQSQ